MSDTNRILLLFSGTRNDINRVLKIAGSVPETAVDLLHIRGLNAHSAPDFPQDVYMDLCRNAANIDRCFCCDGSELRRYLKENDRYDVFTRRCQRCQLLLHLVLAGFIAEKKYERTIWCSPQFDRRIYQSSAGLILGDAEYLCWHYPISDQGIASGESGQRCICDTVLDLDPDLFIDEENMREFCSGIIASGILQRLSMEEAEILPF